MGVIDRIPSPELGVVNRIGVMKFRIKVVTTTSGTIDTAASDTVAQSGVSVVKTATKTGRYTFTLPRPYKALGGVSVTKIGPTDATWGANTTGFDHFVRNDAVATAGTFDLQFMRGSDNADAEVPDAASFIVTISVEKGV